MSILTREEVGRIARLARIELSSEELEKYLIDLNKVLGYIEVLKSVDTEGVEPLAQVTGFENVYREDIAEVSPIAGELLSCAPETSGRFIKVKKVL